MPILDIPLALDTLSKGIDAGWDRAVHGVYNSLDRNIGFFRSDQLLSQGIIELYSGEKNPGPSGWRVKNAFGVLVPATDYVLAHGLKPSWLTENDAQVLHDAKIAPPITLPDFHLPTFSLPGVESVSRLGTYALYGATALLLLTVLRRRA